MGYKLLLVDDEEGILLLLKDYFGIQGYEILTADTGEQAVELALGEKPELILLDINLPDMDGLEVCRRIREQVECPILFLTAKIEEQDRINGLLMGGDDYILKPFSIEELGARVIAHLRRENRGRKRNGYEGEDKRKEIGEERRKARGEEREGWFGRREESRGLRISYSQREVWYEEKNIRLTKTEFDILELLSMNPGQVFGKEQIYEKVRGFEAEGDSSIVMEHIRRIRNKIGACTEKEYIMTVWGVGYKWIG